MRGSVACCFERLEQLQKEMLAEPPEEMLAMMQQMDAPVRELVQLTIDFGKAFAEKKREDGIIDFARQQVARQVPAHRYPRCPPRRAADRGHL